MHNVHVDRIEETQRKAKDNRSVATLAVELRGDWRSNPRQKQFGGTVIGKTTLWQYGLARAAGAGTATFVQMNANLDELLIDP